MSDARKIHQPSIAGGGLSAAALEGADRLAREFAHAQPFPHIVIDGFLTKPLAEGLLREFPPFERGNATNEAGKVGHKSVVECVRGLGAAYVQLDDLVRGEPFLRWLSQVTGIPGLLYDPDYIGGGTHENRQGQDLDPHLDFNRHPLTHWHRRLNLIVYLNTEWQDAWGGSLELHSDPRASNNRVHLVTPLFNRAVLFETSEISWHGFERIALPPDRQELSRKSVALYFYSKHRPAEQTADTHSTIYVDRPLPERFSPGHTLDHRDVELLELLLARRDQHNQRLYGELMAKTRALEQLGIFRVKRLIRRLRRLGRKALGRE